ncbi:MAG: GNAT family N-acetyltransferase [Bdellovibrionales bacterium]|jgi:predicted GNAT family N-acyltransferase
MALSARLLVPGDEKLLSDFLKPYTPFAFFMCSNLAKTGLGFEGKPFQGEYFGAFNGDNLQGVLMHGWAGNVQVFAIDLYAIPIIVNVWHDHLAKTPRKIEIFLGPANHVKALLSSIGLNVIALRKEGVEEGLCTLSLEKMIMPSLLQKEGIIVRHAQSVDTDTLAKWRHDFFVEALGSLPGQQLYDVAKAEIINRTENKEIFVLEDHGRTSSFCGVGGSLPDWTNVGPVWTPPDYRNKGYGRTVIAGALLALRQKGIANAVLFSSRADAQKAYRALGFNQIGDWIFDFLKKPIDRL